MTQSTNKVPLALAAQNLATIMEALDNETGDISTTITNTFNESRLDLSAACDRRICFFSFAESSLAGLKATRDYYALKAKQLEHVIEAVKTKTIQIMDQAPDLPYKGELGRLRIQNNSQSSLELKFELGKKSVSNILSESDIDRFKIPAELIESVSFTTLKTDTIKKLIESGEKIEWADVRKGRHLRYK